MESPIAKLYILYWQATDEGWTKETWLEYKRLLREVQEEAKRIGALMEQPRQRSRK